MQRTIVSPSNGAMVDRLIRLRQAHKVLAQELGSAQRRLADREREVRELRALLAAKSSG